MSGKKGSKWMKNPEDNMLCWEFYKKQNPLMTRDECEVMASKYRKSRNKGSIEYYRSHYPDLSEDDHLRMLREFQENYKKSQPTHMEYWMNKYPNLSYEEQQDLFHRYMRSTNGGCIEYYERKYPDKTPEQRHQMLNEWLQKHRDNQPKLVGDKNPGHSSNTTTLARKQRSPKCIEFYELRYPNLTPNEQLAMLNEHKAKSLKITKDKTNQVLCIDYWLKRGYSYCEAELKLKQEYSKRASSLNKYIKKYGEEKGTKLFKERQIKWQKSLKEHFEKYGDGRSPQSSFASYLINKIYDHLKSNKPLVEKYIKDKHSGRSYAYDFCYKNIIIEFNGDYWHMNPLKYKPTDINKTTKQQASDKWKDDEYKVKLAESYGYKVLIIWESEFNEDSKATLNKCMDFINENVNN